MPLPASSLVPDASTQHREITLLFADLRGFTDLSARLEIGQTDALLGEVMDSFTTVIADNGGFIIDYFGDGLAAMWNAPAEQAQHPLLACRAALRLIESLPPITARWGDVLHTELRVGIGIHTGLARVGNAGSSRQVKYGPRGATVHLASRIESATKELSLPLLVSWTTAERLSGEFVHYRVCRARLAGFHQPIDLYTLSQPTQEVRLAAMWRTYDEALRQFEQGHLLEARCMLAAMDPAVQEVPVRFLAEHIDRALGSQQGRRRTDRSHDAPAGVIVLDTK
jgi:adenylate cyclase